MKFHEVDLASITVGKLRGAKDKRYSQVTLENQPKEKLMFQIPGGRLLFEPNEYNSILVSIENEDFLHFLEEFQNVVLSELHELETIDMGLKTSEMYAPSFRIKLSDETGYYDEEGKRSEKHQVLEKGNDIHILCQLNCIYQIEGRAGISWKAIQIRKGVKSSDSQRKNEPDSEKEEYQFLD